MKTEFFMPMKNVPKTTHQQKKIHIVNAKPFYYEPPNLKSARASLLSHLAPHIPSSPYTSAVRLIVKWCFPISGKHLDGEYKITRPDTDNLNKLLKDVMSTLNFWSDDSIVASEIIEKFYAINSGIYICVEDLM